MFTLFTATSLLLLELFIYNTVNGYIKVYNEVITNHHLITNRYFSIIENYRKINAMSISKIKILSSLNDFTELTAVERLSRTFSFYSAAIPLFAKYKSFELSMKFKKENLGENITEESEKKLLDEIHDWGSDLITSKITELKGYYVKTGQIISTRVDIFPKQYTSKLAMTQDNLDPLPGDIIKEVVERELLNGGKLDELFLEFDDLPLGI